MRRVSEQGKGRRSGKKEEERGVTIITVAAATTTTVTIARISLLWRYYKSSGSLGEQGREDEDEGRGEAGRMTPRETKGTTRCVVTGWDPGLKKFKSTSLV